MKTFCYLLFIVMMTACTKNLNQLSEAKFDSESETKSYEKAWVLNETFMGVAIALDGDRYYYWFYSDVISENEPLYPLMGTYDMKGNILTLHGNSEHLFWDSWKIFDRGGHECLRPVRNEKEARYYLVPMINFDESKPFDSHN